MSLLCFSAKTDNPTGLLADNHVESVLEMLFNSLILSNLV